MDGDELRGPRGEYDWWTSFTAGHPDLEDALLQPLAELGDLSEPAPPKALNPAPEDARTPEEVDAAVPLEDHLKPYDVTENMSDEEVAELAEKMTRVFPRLTAYNGAKSLIAFEVSNQLRDMLCVAWDHYQDHGCEGGAKLLDRLMEQLISGFHIARGLTEGDD